MKSPFRTPPAYELDQQASFIENQQQCVLCNRVLEIATHVEKDMATVVESAFCPHCRQKTRVKEHALH